MNDASESSMVTCVKLVENHAPAFMASRHALTPEDRRRLLRDKSIISIAPPAPNIFREKYAAPKFYGGHCGFKHPANIAATAEILALGNKRKRGDARPIIRKHEAHEQTVYKMLHRAGGKSLPKTQRKSA